MASIYDSADIYDLIENQERYEVYSAHWKNIFQGKNISSMLDVSIGTGSVTIPAVDYGVSLCGSDLSETMLKRCSEKLAGKDAELKKSDFRDLSCWENRKFDMVASTGNSLAYVSNDDVMKAIEQMDSHVAEDGYIYIDTRNWDKILRERNRFYLYNPFFVDDTRINFIQVWDYNPDSSMTFNLLYTFEKNNKIFKKEKFDEHYIPVSKELITTKLEELGYGDIQIMSFPSQFPMKSFDDTDWYCLVAKRK